MKHLFFALLLAITAQFSYSQSIHYVDPSPYRAPEHFANLQAAVTAASHGDTIYLAPGNVGGATVNKKLSLIAGGYDHMANDSVYQLQVPSGNSTISNTIEFIAGADSSMVQGCSIHSLRCTNVIAVRIIRNLIYNKSVLGYGLFVSGSTGIEVISNFFDYMTGTRLLLSTSTQNRISGNIFFQPFNQTNLNVQGSADAYVDGNVFTTQVAISVNSVFSNNISLCNSCNSLATSSSQVFNNIFAGNAAGVNSSNIVNYGEAGICIGWPNASGYSFDKRFQLAPGSPGVGFASNGGDCGAFGGPEPYKLSGVPARPLFTDFSQNTSVPTSGLLQVSIKVNAQN